MNRTTVRKKVLGCLIGGAIGDAMGAPVEAWHYERIIREKGYVDDFEGDGTDDSVIKLILCEALVRNGGHASADDFAESFLRHDADYKWFYIPVRNMFHKIKDRLTLPVHAGYDNMASSSSAMAISPFGIVNACDPRTAAAAAYEAAGLIHSGVTSFCRDGAAAMAAAVSAAFFADASVDAVLRAAVDYLHPQSAVIMRDKINETLSLAKESGSYESFRELFYAQPLYHTMCDARETVPVALSLFYLAGGDVNRTVMYGANFGRDADTIATMAGAVAGAFCGLDGLKKEWAERMLTPKQEKLADDLTDLIELRCRERKAVLAALDAI